MVQNSTILLLYRNKLLIIRDRKTKQWMVPGGRMEPNESPWETALREFHEETGYSLKFAEILAQFEYKSTMIFVVKSRMKAKYHPTLESDDHQWMDFNQLDKTNLKGYVINGIKHAIRHSHLMIYALGLELTTNQGELIVPILPSEFSGGYHPVYHSHYFKINSIRRNEQGQLCIYSNYLSHFQKHHLGKRQECFPVLNSEKLSGELIIYSTKLVNID